MNVLTICHEYPPIGGGGATACSVLAEALVRAGDRVDVVTSGMPGLAACELRNGVRIHRVRCVRRRRYYSTAAELATWVAPALRAASRLAHETAYDVIHCHFVVPGGIVARRLARRTGLPWVLTAHGSDVPGYNPDRFARLHRLIGPWWRRIVREATAVTTPTRFLADLVGHALARPIVVLANPFDGGPVPSGPRENRILVATRLVERKGVGDLIAALEGLNSGWRLSIVGDGPLMGRLHEQAAAGGLDAEFLGFTSRERLGELYGRARIFALPSLQENFPMVLIEAMAHGCAVVTTTAPGCVETVGDAALLVPPGDVAALGASIRSLMDDPELARQLGARGVERAAQFASCRVAGEFRRLFRLCIARAGGGAASAAELAAAGLTVVARPAP